MFNLIVCRLKNTKKKRTNRATFRIGHEYAPTDWQQKKKNSPVNLRLSTLLWTNSIYRWLCRQIRLRQFFFSFYCYKLKCFKTKGEGISEIVMKQHETE